MKSIRLLITDMPFGLIIIGATYVVCGSVVLFGVLSLFEQPPNIGLLVYGLLTYGLLSLVIICTGVGVFLRIRAALTFLLIVAFIEFLIGAGFLYHSIPGLPVRFSVFGVDWSGETDPFYAIPGAALILFSPYQYIVLTTESSRKWFRSFTANFRSLCSREPTTQRVLKGASLRSILSFTVVGAHSLLLVFCGATLLVPIMLLGGVPYPLGILLGVLFLILLIPFALLAPSLILLPATAMVALLWPQPPRVLLLRPFNRAKVGATLKSLIRESVGILGHVYTLSDSSILQKWYIRWPVLLPQTWILHFRLKRISNEGSITKLESVVRRSWFRNINWFASYSKVFPISCSDTHWQGCVQKLLGLCDVILVELSGATRNIMWEIEEIRRTNLLDQTIFIVNVEDLGRALEFCSNLNIDPKNTGNLYVYDAYGLQEFDAMVIELSRIIGKSG